MPPVKDLTEALRHEAEEEKEQISEDYLFPTTDDAPYFSTPKCPKTKRPKIVILDGQSTATKRTLALTPNLSREPTNKVLVVDDQSAVPKDSFTPNQPRGTTKRW